MGRATIVGSKANALHTVTYNPRPESVETELLAIGKSLDRLNPAITEARESLELRKLETQNAADAVAAMIDDYLFRVANGLDPDPPIDPKPPTDENTDPKDDPMIEGEGGMENVPSDLIAAHNSIRSAAGERTLSMNSALSLAAQRQANYMASIDQSTHTGKGGTTPQQRIAEAGYPMTGGTGENCAAGQGTIEALMNAWMNSSGHRANILRPQWTEMGVGYAYRESGTYRHYFCVTFGVP